MTPFRFYTDEDIYRAIADRLRAAGHDAISTPEAGRMGADDASQLTWAAQQNRAIISFNVSDFARLHHQWMNNGRHHSGIIVAKRFSVGELVRRLLTLAGTLGAEDMEDRLEYLSSWS